MKRSLPGKRPFFEFSGVPHSPAFVERNNFEVPIRGRRRDFPVSILCFCCGNANDDTLLEYPFGFLPTARRRSEIVYTRPRRKRRAISNMRAFRFLSIRLCRPAHVYWAVVIGFPLLWCGVRRSRACWSDIPLSQSEQTKKAPQNLCGAFTCVVVVYCLRSISSIPFRVAAPRRMVRQKRLSSSRTVPLSRRSSSVLINCSANAGASISGSNNSSLRQVSR